VPASFELAYLMEQIGQLSVMEDYRRRRRSAGTDIGEGTGCGATRWLVSSLTADEGTCCTDIPVGLLVSVVAAVEKVE
jgi:hypothetical protein